MSGNAAYESYVLVQSENDRLFNALTEQLKLPFLQIAQHVELVKMGEQQKIHHIEAVANMALQLIEGYQLSRQFSADQLSLMVEPVSVSQTLHAAAEKLTPLAKEYKCDLRLDIGGKYGPILAYRKGLEAAVIALAHSFIEAQQQAGAGRLQLILGAHKSNKGIMVGAFSDKNPITSDMLRRSKHLYGSSRQSIPGFGHTPSAGIFVADTLFSAMASRLIVSRHTKLTGLAAMMLPSPQLRLV